MVQPRFLADVNVGKLAKWLRILGYDTLFVNPAEDEELLRRAHEEQRLLLTRDRGFLRRRVVHEGLVQVLVLRSDSWQEQLHQVTHELALPLLEGVFTRCVRCNVLLTPRDREAVRGHVPPYVYTTQHAFKECPQCGRIYWRGTHWDHVQSGLQRLKRGGTGTTETG